MSTHDTPEITVIIPCRQTDRADVTLDSLAGQTLPNFATVVVYDQDNGAAWARNRGFALCRSPFVVFSDCDVRWRPDAFERLYWALAAEPKNAAYAYGDYGLDGKLKQPGPFDPKILIRKPYIPTMAMMRADSFPGFDESLARFQDWDLWLALLSRGFVGVYVAGPPLWETRLSPDGISQQPGMEKWVEIVRRKWARLTREIA